MGDYYQSVVCDYLRADPSVFISTECTIQIERGGQSPKGENWLCDAVAADFKSGTIFLCEVTHSETLQALLKRLGAWNEHWNEFRQALIDKKYNKLPADWAVRPWLFIPEGLKAKLNQGLEKIKETGGQLRFEPKITTLEEIQSWKYRTWNRIRDDEECEESDPVLIEMRRCG